MKRVSLFKLKLKKRNFHRYIISYLLVFLIPFSIISFIWYQTSTESLNKQIELSTRNYLLQVRSIFYTNFSQLDLLTREVGSNPKTTPKMAAHPYYSTEMMKELQRYKITNNVIEEMYLYYDEEPNKLYSSAGSVDFNTFNSFRYQSFDFGSTELSENLKTKVPKFQMIPPLEDRKKIGLLTYTVPLTSADGTHYGAVLYTMKSNNIESILEKSIDQNSGRLFILDADRNVLASSKNTPIPEFFDTEKKIQKSITKNTLKTDYGRIKVDTLEDSDFGLTYVALTNVDEVFKELNRTNRFVLLTVFVVMILGAGIVLFIGRKQYTPIRKLEKLLKSTATDDEAIDNVDSFDHFEYHVSNFLKQNENLHQEIKRQTPYAKEQVLRRLMMGRFNNQEETETLLDSVNLLFFNKGYFVMLIDTKMVNTKTSIQNQEFLMNFLDDISGTGFQAYGSELLSDQAIALLVSMDGSMKQPTIVREIVRKIIVENTVAPIIGVGRVVTELKNINRSYIESLAAIQSVAFTEQKSKVYYYDKISETNDKELGISYPKDEKLKLTQSLLQGDFEIASETIDWLIGIPLNNPLNHEAMKLYGFDLLTTVVNVGMETVGADILLPAEHAANFRNLSELRDSLIQISRQICVAAKSDLKNQESQLQKEIFGYLEQHFASHDITLELLAEEFDVSISYLSRFIKKETGLTFSKYIQELRLEHIKKELIETDKPIKEIILSSGYYDVSNYTRKFKTIVGMTPGQFRSKNR